MMNKIRTSRFVEYGLAPLLLFAAMAPSAVAKRKAEKPVDPVTVVAHLLLPGAAVSQIFLQGQGSKQYLYIQQDPEQGLTIVDVTKPFRPNVVNRLNLPNKSSGEELQMVWAGLAISEAPEARKESARTELAPAKGEGIEGGGSGGTGDSPTQFLRLLDLSDPANPRTLQTFEGVSSLLLDDGRDLIYITNGEGLWILSHNVPPPHPICDSEITDDASCYAY
jgi:hypothetical protein